jgi:hypothetical protein
MSHHFDYPQDETLDITDAYCFAGAGDRHGPRTVFGVNTSPQTGNPWDPAGYYELKIDTNRDYVEDITFRATFPIGADGTLCLRRDHHASPRPRWGGRRMPRRHQALRRTAPRPVLQLHSLPRRDDERTGDRHVPRL